MRSRDLLLGAADYDWITNYYTKWITGHEVQKTDRRWTKYVTKWTTEWTTEWTETVSTGGGGGGGGSKPEIDVSVPAVGVGDMNNMIAAHGEDKTDWVQYAKAYIRTFKEGNGSVSFGQMFRENLMGFRDALIRNITDSYNRSDDALLAEWRSNIRNVNDARSYENMVRYNSNAPGLQLAYNSGNVAFLKQYAYDHPYFFPPFRKLNQAEFNAGGYWNLYADYNQRIVTMRNGNVVSGGGGGTTTVKKSRQTSQQTQRDTVRETIFKYYYWTYYQTSQATSRTTKWYTDVYSDTRMTGVDPNQRYNGHLLSQTYYDRNDESNTEYGYKGENDSPVPIISTNAYNPKIGSIPNRQAIDPNSNKWMESREDRQANQNMSKNVYSKNKNELLSSQSNKRNLQTYYVHNEEQETSSGVFGSLTQ